ncbi:MAG: hypothetical protein AAFP69_20820, partial [Planctomycetota bacterium]
MLEFEKTYTPPRYTKMNTVSVTETVGDLRALRGTKCVLRVRFDQPVDSPELILTDDTGGERTLDLTAVENDAADDGTLFSSTIPIQSPGDYRVAAVSKETQFDNPFASRWPIQSISDLIPKVRLVRPDTNSPRLVAPSHLAAVDVAVEDELPLQSLIQETAIGEGDWVATKLPLNADQDAANLDQFGSLGGGEPYRLEHEWEFDFLTMQPAPQVGDIVRMRVVAVDRRGARGESETFQWTIAEQDFDTQRHARLERMAMLFGTIDKWHSAATRWIEQPLEDAARGDFQRNTDAVKAVAMELMPQSDGVLVADESFLLSTAVDAMLDTARDAQAALADINGNQEDSVKDRDRQKKSLRGGFQRSADRILDAAKSFYYYEVCRAAMVDAAAIYQSQRKLLDAGQQRSNKTSPRLFLRIQTITQARMQQLIGVLQENMDAFDGSRLNHLDDHSQAFGRWSDRLDEQLRAAAKAPEENANAMRRFAAEMAADLNSRWKNRLLDGNLSSTTRDGRKALREIISWNGLQTIALRRIIKRREQYSETAANTSESDRRRDAANAAATAAENLSNSCLALQRRMRFSSDLLRLRDDVPTSAASDSGLLLGALNHLLTDASDPLAQRKHESAALQTLRDVTGNDPS